MSGPFGLSMIGFSILIAYAVYLVTSLGVTISETDGVNARAALALQSNIQSIGYFLMIIFGALITFTTVFFVVYSQRVGGAMVAICAVIDDLKSGNYIIKRKLRDKDELVPIMTKLKELGQTLEEKK